MHIRTISYNLNLLVPTLPSESITAALEHAHNKNIKTQLARKYQQGGIFEYKRGNMNNLIRSTVPVCIPDCQSKAELEIFPLKTHP